MQTELEKPKQLDTPLAPRRRWVPALAAFVIAIVVVGVTLLSADSGSDAARPEDVARAFIAARNTGDAEAAIALLAPDAVIDDSFAADDVAGLREDIVFSRAIGWQENVTECTTTPTGEATRVVCRFTFENDWTRALGVGPFGGGSMYWFVIDGGLIAELRHTTDTGSGFNSEAWQVFQSWIFSNHPADIPVLYANDGTAPLKTREAVSVWKQRTEEFVAEQN